MVWIYGGGLVMGSSATPMYDGTQFARDGVILVSFNYRVGRFGFFGFPALTAANPDGPLVNYGYMDQIAALKWVKANISALGGDPHNITIFGESSGGGSVQMLLTSPMASGLFQKAIVESGGGGASANGYRLVSKDLPNLPSAETIGVNFAKANGIEGIGPEALKALRALPAEKVVLDLGSLAPGRSGSGLPPYPGPVADGKMILAYPDEAYKENHFAHVPLIIGATSADLGSASAKTMDDALTPFGANKGRALEAYDPDHTGDLSIVNARMGVDKDNVGPARFAAQQFAARGVPAYEFRFSFVSPAAGGGGAMAAMMFGAKPSQAMKDYMAKGASHGSEIPYVFDDVFIIKGERTTAQDQATAKSMHTYLVNFAKTGNPNRPTAGNPEWPVYTSESDRLLNFTQRL